jgi:hypothetical protein
VSGHGKPMHGLATLHVLAICALLVWWSLYFWRHTPARELFHRQDEAPAVHHRRPSGEIGDRAAGEFGRKTRDAAIALELAAADIAGGFAVLALFALGSGIYVRRFEVWLQARGSGEAMTFAGTGLDDKALAANKSREART